MDYIGTVQLRDERTCHLIRYGFWESQSLKLIGYHFFPFWHYVPKIYWSTHPGFAKDSQSNNQSHSSTKKPLILLCLTPVSMWLLQLLRMVQWLQQSGSSLHNRLYFFRLSGERQQAWRKQGVADTQNGGRHRKSKACPYTIVCALLPLTHP